MWEKCLPLPHFRNSQRPLQMLARSPDGCTDWCLVTSNHSLNENWGKTGWIIREERKWDIRWQNEKQKKKKAEQDAVRDTRRRTNCARERTAVCLRRTESVTLYSQSHFHTSNPCWTPLPPIQWKPLWTPHEVKRHTITHIPTFLYRAPRPQNVAHRWMRGSTARPSPTSKENTFDEGEELVHFSSARKETRFSIRKMSHKLQLRWLQEVNLVVQSSTLSKGCQAAFLWAHHVGHDKALMDALLVHSFSCQVIASISINASCQEIVLIK